MNHTRSKIGVGFAVLLALCLSLPAAASADTARTFFAGADVKVYDNQKTAVMFGYLFTGGEGYELFYAADGYVIGSVSGDYDRSNIQGILDQFNDYRGVARAEYVILPSWKSPADSGVDIKSGTKISGSAGSGGIVIAADNEAYAKEVFRLVNQERVKAGLDEVYWEEDFAACVQIRAEELTRKFSHTRPEEPKASSRDSWPMNVNGDGVYNAPTVADELGIPYNWVMENAAYGQSTPEGVMNAWMNSSGHRDNILRESHTRCAVGVYTKQSDSGRTTYYWILWLDR